MEILSKYISPIPVQEEKNSFFKFLRHNKSIVPKKSNGHFLEEEKRDFMNKHSNHDVVIQAQTDTQYQKTNCELTALTIHSLFGDDKWTYLTLNSPFDSNSVYQLQWNWFSSNQHQCQHVLTILPSFIVQSFYQQYEYKIVKIDENIRTILERIFLTRKWTYDDFFKLTSYKIEQKHVVEFDIPSWKISIQKYIG